MHNVNNETPSNDKDMHCHKIEFLFCCLTVHVSQIMALTQKYIDHLGDIDDQEFPNKKLFFELIEVKADYAECVLSLRNVLRDEMTPIDENKIAYYRHYLVTQVAKNIQASKRWSRLLQMYKSTRDDKFVSLWCESMKGFEQLSYLSYC
jgi:hypothetical protein